MLEKFRTYQLAVKFYRSARRVKLPYSMKDQLSRASASVALNLSEGNARRTKADRRRMFNIALASLRECETIIEIEDLEGLRGEADVLARHLYCLCRALE